MIPRLISSTASKLYAHNKKHHPVFCPEIVRPLRTLPRLPRKPSLPEIGPRPLPQLRLPMTNDLNVHSGNRSETSKHREKILPFLPPCNLIDIGYGGDPVTPWAVACDMAGGSYTNVGSAPQQLGFDCMSPPFKDGSLDGIYASHLTEDWSYRDQGNMLREWKRCVRSGGVIVILGPDQKRFEAHCAATGQGLNMAHVEPDFSLATFKNRVWPAIRADMAWVAGEDLEDYSFLAVMKLM